MRNNYLITTFLFIVLLSSCNNQNNDNRNFKDFSLTLEEKNRVDSLFNEYKNKFTLENNVSFKKYDRTVNILQKNIVEEQSFVIVSMENKNGDVIGKNLEVKNLTKQISKILYKRLKDSTKYIGVISEIKVKTGSFIIQKEGIMKVGIEFEKPREGTTKEL